MAGVKGKSGGARAGAGRKRQEPAVSGIPDPLEFLKQVWQGHIEATAGQIKAAQAALPFIHGKQPAKKADPVKPTVGRFGAKAPPKLVVNNR